MSGRSTHPGVVVGVDGSASARNAVRWAAREAVMRHVPLTLVHALAATAVSSSRSGWQPAAPIPAELWPRQEDEARKTIADAARVVEDSVDQAVTPQTDTELVYSPPVPALVDLSKEAQLIVVGCRGKSALHRTLLGSVSTGLVHHARRADSGIVARRQ
ncbi:MAG: universal stress protein [Mycobacterium sp.]|uniref:universal stress protein n=1 Tax=Mycobacterium sp. TaxID=1785 RepID=UPI00261FD539|nr:universal stress protein [Mycobacterium sp.]MDI3314081.1 universal stress protein [Mycobacterium sp.]